VEVCFAFRIVICLILNCSCLGNEVVEGLFEVVEVCPESESLKFSATPTPQVENPSDSDSTALIRRMHMLIL